MISVYVACFHFIWHVLSLSGTFLVNLAYKKGKKKLVKIWDFFSLRGPLAMRAKANLCVRHTVLPLTLKCYYSLTTP